MNPEELKQRKNESLEEYKKRMLAGLKTPDEMNQQLLEALKADPTDEGKERVSYYEEKFAAEQEAAPTGLIDKIKAWFIQK